MVLNERQSRADRVFDAGKMMMTAARTAPKAKGLDNLECCLVVGDDIRRMSDMMLMLHEMCIRDSPYPWHSARSG